MTLSSHQACLQYLAEQHRSPSSSSTHPCFREFENESYLQDGLSFAVKVFDRDKAAAAEYADEASRLAAERTRPCTHKGTS
jgi:hypothetical protein